MENQVFPEATRPYQQFSKVVLIVVSTGTCRRVLFCSCMDPCKP